MFDIGSSEILLIAGVGLVVLGPERLTVVARKMGHLIGRGRRALMNLKRQIEDEVGLEELQQQLHESSVVEEIKAAKMSFTEIDTGASSSTDPRAWPGRPPPDA